MADNLSGVCHPRNHINAVIQSEDLQQNHCFFCNEAMCSHCVQYDSVEENYFHYEDRYSCPRNVTPETANPLTVALDITTGPRRKAYGHPIDNFSDIAQGWAVILGAPVLPEQVAMCMIWTKICRECTTPDFDNEVDMAGYVNTLHMVKESQPCEQKPEESK